MQTGGVAILPLQGFVLSPIIFFLILKSNKYRLKISSIHLRIWIVIIIVLFLQNIFNNNFNASSIIQFLYINLILCNAFLFVNNNLNDNLNKDIGKVLNFFLWQSLIGFVFIALFPSLLFKYSINLGSKTGPNFLGLFYANFLGSGPWGFQRSQGLFWEPGVLQIFLNIYLFIAIRNNFRFSKVLLIILGIIVAYSTTGYILLSVNIFYFFIRYNKKYIKLITLLALPFFILLVSLNITNKLYGLDASSSLARNIDAIMAAELIVRSPIIGNGFYNQQELLANSSVESVKYAFMVKNNLNNNTAFEERTGITNGVLDLIAILGIPLGVYFITKLLNQKIIDTNTKLEKLVFFILILVSSLSEPIMLSTFFILLFVSSLKVRKLRLN